MSQQVYTIKSAASTWPVCGQVYEMCQKAISRGPIEIVLRRPKRSNDQNAKMWAMLSDVAEQVEWYGQALSPEDWKHIFTASLTKQRAVPGLDGGFVVLGVSTKEQDKEWFSQLFEVINAFGAEHSVAFHHEATE